MKDSNKTPARELSGGMGQAVADRTILRNIEKDGKQVKETWADVAYRVSLGNSLLCPIVGSVEGREGEALANLAKEQVSEFHAMNHHLRQASVLMSGRHLQHGDETQPERNIEVFTNCLGGETKILTLEFGAIEISKIVNEKVTVKARDGVWREALVSSHGTQKLYEFTFGGISGPLRETNAIKVKATANHRWFLKDGSVTESLKVGDVLEVAKTISDIDEDAVRHGLIFGDGSAHKVRNDYPVNIASQGRDYVAIRLCGADKKYLSLFESYRVNYPKHANGDPVVYVGKKNFWKDLPFTTDPSYIAGFINGWWLADGSKTYDRPGIEISTTNYEAVEWMKEYAAYAGWRFVGTSERGRKEGDGSYANGKTLHVIRLTQDLPVKVREIKELESEEVFCVEEPVTTGFTLANGLITGNCSTSAMSFLSFYLLLNGSGVGRAYDDDMMLVDWNYLPIVIPVIGHAHKDVQSGEIVATQARDVEHFYKGKNIITFEVPDSREGWTKAFEKMEYLAFTKEHQNSVLIMDFSNVRARGEPIKGMQNRPASGPGPMMTAVSNIAKLRTSGMAAWRSTMFADHYLAECVLVGGARRAARMATKFWKDETIFDFISLKQGGFLWSSNNSVTVDADFWRYAKGEFKDDERSNAEVWKLAEHAKAVFEAVCSHSYHDKTGEPGFINVDKLTWSNDGIEALLDGNFAKSEKLQLSEETLELSKALANAFNLSESKTITNPCGEIVLGKLGGYCVIADIVPYHAGTEAKEYLDADGLLEWDEDAEDAFKVATRALIRTNLMDALYAKEVKRTNRIGVGMTGLHEYAWARFGYGWKDIVDEEKSIDFWLTLARFKRAVQDEAKSYSELLGVAVPHTNTTMKPSGTTSKLFGLTEGAHLPSMREYIRWVQFRNDDPLIAEYEALGYPVQHLVTYSGTTIVGFPTAPIICTLGMGDALVTAAEATPEEQYQYLRLLEKYWITGVEEDGVTKLEERGNQVSYTLKYNPIVVSYDEFKRTLLEGQSSIRCCSVMPQVDSSAYEYTPEEVVTKARYEMISEAIKAASQGKVVEEDVGVEHVACEGGACPISFGENSASK